MTRALTANDTKVIRVGTSGKNIIITLTKAACDVIKNNGVAHYQMKFGDQEATLTIINEKAYAKKAALAMKLSMEAQQSVELDKQINAELNPESSKIIL